MTSTVERTGASPGSEKYEWLILSLILTIGTIIRLYALGDESLWFDEACTVREARLPFLQILSKTDVNPPLYHIFIHFWIRLFGDSEFSLRLPSVVFGVLSILLCYKIGRMLVSTKVGIVTALLLALSEFHVYYAQEARTYTLGVVLTLLSMYFFFLLTEGKSRSCSVLYVLFSVLLLYAHVYGTFVVLAQNICVGTMLLFPRAFKSEITVKFWLGTQLLIVLVFSPWCYFLYGQILRVQDHFWIPVPGIGELKDTLVRHAGSRSLLLVYAVFILRLIVLRWNCERTRRILLFLALWLWIPIIFPFVISHFSGPIYFYRYTIFSSTALYILAAMSVTDTSKKYVMLTVIVFASIVSTRNVINYHEQLQKAQWREAVDFVESLAETNDLLLIEAHEECFAYYSTREDIVAIKMPKVGKRSSSSHVANHITMLNQRDRCWIISRPGSAARQLERMMRRQAFSPTQSKKFHQLDVYKFERSSLAPTN